MSDDGERVSTHEAVAFDEAVCAGCLSEATHTHGTYGDDPGAPVIGCCGARACCDPEDGHEE